MRKSIIKSQLEDLEGDRRVSLRCILVIQSLRMRGGWNLIRIVSNGLCLVTAIDVSYFAT